MSEIRTSTGVTITRSSLILRIQRNLSIVWQVSCTDHRQSVVNYLLLSIHGVESDNVFSYSSDLLGTWAPIEIHKKLGPECYGIVGCGNDHNVRRAELSQIRVDRDSPDDVVLSIGSVHDVRRGFDNPYLTRGGRGERVSGAKIKTITTPESYDEGVSQY